MMAYENGIEYYFEINTVRPRSKHTGMLTPPNIIPTELLSTNETKSHGVEIDKPYDRIKILIKPLCEAVNHNYSRT